MGRPREFDTETVLDAATLAFWERGYESTSLSDLMEATGLQKGSIYKAFGDKHTLFVRVLKRYLDGAYASLLATLGEAPGPRAGMEAWLRRVSSPCGGNIERGCLALNTIVEQAPHDPEVHALLSGHLARVEAAMAGTVAQGQARGEFRRDVDPAAQARLLGAVMSGLSAATKCRCPDDPGPEETIDAALRALAPPRAH